MPTKLIYDENTRFLYSCLIRSDWKSIDFRKVATDFGINPPAARMRWARLRRNMLLHCPFKNDPNAYIFANRSYGIGDGRVLPAGTVGSAVGAGFVTPDWKMRMMSGWDDEEVMNGKPVLGGMGTGPVDEDEKALLEGWAVRQKIKRENVGMAAVKGMEARAIKAEDANPGPNGRWERVKREVGGALEGERTAASVGLGPLKTIPVDPMLQIQNTDVNVGVFPPLMVAQKRVEPRDETPEPPLVSGSRLGRLGDPTVTNAFTAAASAGDAQKSLRADTQQNVTEGINDSGATATIIGLGPLETNHNGAAVDSIAETTCAAHVNIALEAPSVTRLSDEVLSTGNDGDNSSNGDAPQVIEPDSTNSSPLSSLSPSRCSSPSPSSERLCPDEEVVFDTIVVRAAARALGPNPVGRELRARKRLRREPAAARRVWWNARGKSYGEGVGDVGTDEGSATEGGGERKERR